MQWTKFGGLRERSQMFKRQEKWNGKRGTVPEASIICVNETCKIFGKQSKAISDDNVVVFGPVGEIYE